VLFDTGVAVVRTGGRKNGSGAWLSRAAFLPSAPGRCRPNRRFWCQRPPLPASASAGKPRRPARCVPGSPSC